MLVSVVLVFVWCPSVVEPVSVLVVVIPISILIIVIPVCVVLVSLFVSWLLLVVSVPAIVSAVVACCSCHCYSGNCCFCNLV